MASFEIFVNAFLIPCSGQSWEIQRCRSSLLSAAFVWALAVCSPHLCSGVQLNTHELHASHFEDAQSAARSLQQRSENAYRLRNFRQLQEQRAMQDGKVKWSHRYAETDGPGPSSGDSVGSTYHRPQKQVDFSEHCGTVEEMGAASVGDSRQASLRVRKMIQSHLEEHGAANLRELPEEVFCQRSFVFARPQHDGLGNNLYKILTGAGLSIMLNRSLIMGEAGTKNMSSAHPEFVFTKLRVRFLFGEYIEYSPEILSMQETRALWATNGCESRYGRPLTLRTVHYTSLANPSLLCDDWTTYTEPIVQLWDATDSSALQAFQKSRHVVMRKLAVGLLGNSWDPDSRPNTFGELARVLMKPKVNVQRAIDWTLEGEGEPDVVLHMRHGKLIDSLEAASLCVLDALNRTISIQRAIGGVRVAIVADDPTATKKIAKLLKGKAHRDDSEGRDLNPNEVAIADLKGSI